MGPWMSQVTSPISVSQIHFVDIKSTKSPKSQMCDSRPGINSTTSRDERLLHKHFKNPVIWHITSISTHGPEAVSTSLSWHDFGSQPAQKVLTGHVPFLLSSLPLLNACLLGPLLATFFKCLTVASWQYCSSAHWQTHATAEQASGILKVWYWY